MHFCNMGTVYNNAAHNGERGQLITVLSSMRNYMVSSAEKISPMMAIRIC